MKNADFLILDLFKPLGDFNVRDPLSALETVVTPVCI